MQGQDYCKKCNADYLPHIGCFCATIGEPHPVLLNKPGMINPVGVMKRYKPATMLRVDGHLGGVEL